MTELLARGADSYLEAARRVAVALAQRAIAEVPAYASHVGPERSVDTFSDFERLPTTSKKDYLQIHPLSALCWGGTLRHPLLLCATSGSTGDPFYFPRSEQLAVQYAQTLRRFIEEWHRPGTTTLALVGYGMGVWIAGNFTVRALELVQSQVPGLSILPVGVNGEEIRRALRRLAPHYDQTLLVGYPPFVREVLVDARDAGIDLASLNLRLGFAAESFNEAFRSYVCELAGIPMPERHTFNIYGSADLGAMAAETPTSILCRQHVLADRDLSELVFGEAGRTPTLAQFEPGHILFEQLDGQIAVTGDSALPLTRYLIGDRGGVLSYTDLKTRASSVGFDLEQALRARGIDPDPRPFVFVYERVDLAASLFGLLVYPEFIKRGLDDLVANGVVTGKFSMHTAYTDSQRQYLQVHVECNGRGIAVPADDVATAIEDSLRDQSSEFRELSGHMNGAALLQVQMWPSGASPYFTPGSKQRWLVQPLGKDAQ